MTKSQTRSPRLPASAGSPDVFAGVQQIVKGVHSAGVSRQTLELVHMSTSQLNGCGPGIASGIDSAEKIGLGAARLLALPAWRESPLYDDAERAAVELAEAMTRLADDPGVVTDEIWSRAAEHYD